MTDTIAAIATPNGSGGIGVIRISGPDAFSMAGALFSKQRNPLSPVEQLVSHQVIHGYVFDPQENLVIDEVLLVPMAGPRSYTAEDVVEIQAHSGAMVLRAILEHLFRLGARPADPGEFTKRAFLNGRIDLTQAEAVVDIINAKSANALKFAATQNLGGIRNRIDALRDRLMKLLARVEADIDFPDDVEAFEPTASDTELMDSVLDECRGFIRQHEDACFLKDGIRIVICGPPNVGKSSLMNQLLSQDRSIVTAVPGTTRDPIEEGMNMGGIPFVISDTAGIHQTDDLVEIIGMEKAKDHIQQADIVLFMKEAGSDLTETEMDRILDLKALEDHPAGRRVVFVVNKIDIKDPAHPRLPEKYDDIPRVAISALTGEGLEPLKEKIVSISLAGIDTQASSILPNLRHKSALEEAVVHLEAANAGMLQACEPELLAIDIKAGIDSLGTITGETASLDILDSIFDNFCIGK